jgi:hypothetical protein
LRHRQAEQVVGAQIDRHLGKFAQYHHSPEPIDVAYPPAFKGWAGA